MKPQLQKLRRKATAWWVDVSSDRRRRTPGPVLATHSLKLEGVRHRLTSHCCHSMSKTWDSVLAHCKCSKIAEGPRTIFDGWKVMRKVWDLV